MALGRIHKEYRLPFADLGVGADLREVKKHPDYAVKREEILEMIWNMEEEIMGRTWLQAHECSLEPVRRIGYHRDHVIGSAISCRLCGVYPPDAHALENCKACPQKRFWIAQDSDFRRRKLFLPILQGGVCCRNLCQLGGTRAAIDCSL